MPTDLTSAYLDPATLAAVEHIDLRARMIVEGMMTGMHRSPMQGFSVEFAQHRPYTPGDDTRFLDWKVFGKTDKLYLKQYQKETNLDLVVLVDISGSMAYTSQANGWRKFDHAASAAAAMAYMALQQSDRVAVTVFAENSKRATRLSNNKGHWRDIVEVLSHAELHVASRGVPAPGGISGGISGGTSGGGDAPARGGETSVPGRTDLPRLFDEVAARVTRRSLICLISDLIDDPLHLERGLARLNYRRHDVIIMQVLDPAELTFPFRDPSDFLGLEAEGRLAVDPAQLRKAYLSVLDDHQRAVERAARNHKFDHLLLNSSQPLGPALSHFLAKRAAMMR